MTREDEALRLALSRVSKDSGAFVLDVLENNISRDDQITFDHRLADLAEAIRERALRIAGLVIEDSVSDDDSTESDAVIR